MVGPSGILDQSDIDLSSTDSKSHGFKNISLVTIINRQTIFVKVGEPASSGPYSQACAELRQFLELKSVKVVPILVRVRKAEDFIGPVRRGQEFFKQNKNKAR